MDRRELLALARVVTRSLRDRGHWVGYLETVELVASLAGEEWWDDAMDSGESGKPGLDEIIVRLTDRIATTADVTLDPGRIHSALAAPTTTPDLVLWPDGPPPGVYVTTSWAAAEAAILRYSPATSGAALFTDNHLLRSGSAVDLGESQDFTHLYPRDSPEFIEPTGIFSARLASASSGALIILGPVDLAQHDLFHSAEKLHEGCYLAREYGHRIIAIIRTPRPELLAEDLSLALDIEEYYDREYVASALQGTVDDDGQLTRGLRLGAPALSSSAAATFRPLEKLPWEQAAALRDSIERGRMIGGYAWRESVFAWSAMQPAVNPRRTGRRAGERSSGGTIAKPHARESLPDELASLLRKGVERRHTGFLILGGYPGTAERELLLSKALRETEIAGPAALILPSYRGCDFATHIESVQTDDGQATLRSRRFPLLPLFSSVESAYASGYRRIAVEYEYVPYRPLPCDVLLQCADEVCFVICVNDVEAGNAFEWACSSALESLETVIAVLCWGNFPGNAKLLSLYDAFVPRRRSINTAQYEQLEDAVRDFRQLRWEQQALNLLETGQVTVRQLRKYLHACDLVDPIEDFEAEEQTITHDGLRAWLAEKMVSRRKAASTSSSRVTDQYH